MALIDELKDKLETVEAELAGFHADVREIGKTIETLERRRWDLDTAIAALTPAPDFSAEQETAREQLEREPEIPEGFTAWAGGVYGDFVRDNPSMDRVATELEVILRNGTRCKGLPGGFIWNHEGVWNDIVAYRIIEAAPTDEQDDASEFAEPVEEAPALNEAMQDEREEPVALAQPEWNEPQPTEGYAPVTNPEADALARAHDYYDPKAVADRERNAGLAKLFSYNPFYKPKVEA